MVGTSNLGSWKSHWYCSLPASKQTSLLWMPRHMLFDDLPVETMLISIENSNSLPKRNSFRDYLSNQITLSTYIYIYIGVYIYIYIGVYIYILLAIYGYNIYIYINLNIWILSLYIYILCGSSRLYWIVGLDFPSCQVHQWPLSRGQLGRWFGGAINWKGYSKMEGLPSGNLT